VNAPAELKSLLLRAPALTLAAVSGASAYFLGGITAYSLDEKAAHLGVNRAAARKVNCVSAAVAEQMARGACELFGSDLAVATTGYAEPNAKLRIAAPFAWWAIAHRRRGRFSAVRSGRVECPGATRPEAQAMVADAAIAELIAFLRELRG
jgi:nicotinamide-nucleotide amidase